MSRKNNPYRDELKIARSQFRRLKTMASKLTDMAVEWDGLCGGLECDFQHPGRRSGETAGRAGCAD